VIDLVYEDKLAIIEFIENDCANDLRKVHILVVDRSTMNEEVMDLSEDSVLVIGDEIVKEFIVVLSEFSILLMTVLVVIGCVNNLSKDDNLDIEISTVK
jgi:hypothetical protein